MGNREILFVKWEHQVQFEPPAGDDFRITVLK